MKIALISDIHGNSVALSSVIKDIESNNVDLIVCLGDVATLGPSPKETVKMIRGLNCPCILGNHEEALFSPDKSDYYDVKGDGVKESLYWCLNKLGKDDMQFLHKFMNIKEILLDDGRIFLCYHGTPTSTTGSIYDSTSNNVIEGFLDQSKVNNLAIAAGGHTHIQMNRKYNDILLINPGSVGCAFKFIPESNKPPLLSSLAEYAIIESIGSNISVELKKIEYDVSKYISILKESNLPLKGWWLDEFRKLGY